MTDAFTDPQIDAAIARLLARQAARAPDPPPSPVRVPRPTAPIQLPCSAPSWFGDVPAATLSANTVHVRLWASGDFWHCAVHGTGQAAGCLHVSFARERASDRSETTGQLHQDTSWTDFTCRANVTLTSLRFSVKPRRTRKEPLS